MDADPTKQKQLVALQQAKIQSRQTESKNRISKHTLEI